MRSAVHNRRGDDRRTTPRDSQEGVAAIMIDKCPDPAELADLIGGRLPDDRHDAVEQHVAQCTDCLERLDELDEPFDLFVETLTECPSPSTDEPQFRAALERLKSGRGGDAGISRAFIDPLSFTTLGDFRIIREIGRGGMGVVYEAEQLSLSRHVALKVLSAAPLADPRKLARFENEARAAASLIHPHIVDVYAVGVERDVHYYAMRLIDGRNLGQVISELRDKISDADSERLTLTVHASFASLAQIADWGIQAADALHYAHELGIVHRDVKPSNLLLDDQQHLWVTDFGVAQVATRQSLTMTGDVVGTLRYLSPEQASGQRGLIDHRTDVYGLGATLYELITLQPLYTGEPAEILLKIISASPVPPRKLNPGIPIDLETIILQAIAKEPADRYQTAAELAADLRRFVERRTILASRPTLADRVLKWTWRHRSFATAVVALTVLSSLGGGCLSMALMVRNSQLQHAVAAAELTARQALERPAAMRLQKSQKPLTSDPFLVTFDNESFAHGILYENGLFSVPVAGVYVVTASAYIEHASKRRIEIRVYGQDDDPSTAEAKEVLVLQQTIVERENQHNSTVIGTTSLYVDADDRISVWVDAGGSPGARIATTPACNWVSISLINQVREAQR